MGETLFKVSDGKVYFDNRGYETEECFGIINTLVNLINTGVLPHSEPRPKDEPKNVVNYEDILDKRIINGDNSKSTLKLKEWLDNDPIVIAEDVIVLGDDK